MNKQKKNNQNAKGFSAVELLATMFIAFLFLSMGYTLYGAIVNSSSIARHRAQADNIALEYLRRYEATATNPCSASTPVNQAPVTSTTTEGIANPRVTVKITCQNSTVTLLSLVEVQVTYVEGGESRSVSHKVYASIQ